MLKLIAGNSEASLPTNLTPLFSVCIDNKSEKSFKERGRPGNRHYQCICTTIDVCCYYVRKHV